MFKIQDKKKTKQQKKINNKDQSGNRGNRKAIKEVNKTKSYFLKYKTNKHTNKN